LGSPSRNDESAGDRLTLAAIEKCRLWQVLWTFDGDNQSPMTGCARNERSTLIACGNTQIVVRRVRWFDACVKVGRCVGAEPGAIVEPEPIWGACGAAGDRSTLSESRILVSGFELSPKTLDLIQNGQIRFVIDQRPYVYGFYPVVALTLNLRYGIAPSDVDAGANVVDRKNVKDVMQLTAKGYR
jgi:hypothetical protein